MSFLDAHTRLESLSRMGEPLEPLKALIPWEEFRPLLATVHEKARKSNAGRNTRPGAAVSAGLDAKRPHRLDPERGLVRIAADLSPSLYG